MAGDHRCPVCQATFTRPQHVSRHMRSHTGDRPYKCQHCEDQFARSDLLSRHINKCHPGEKATPKDPGSKRKTNLVNRATTSKQACDQCVQNSFTCDGASPCSKCLSRKINCTFVKFHRQTAPVGPGHPAPTSQHDVSGDASYSQPSQSDLLLPSTQFDQFAFNPPPQFYQPQLSYAGDQTRLARSASVDYGHHRPPVADFLHYGTKYHAAWDGSPVLSGNWNGVHNRTVSYASEDSGSEAPSSARSSNVNLPLDLGYGHPHHVNQLDQSYDISQPNAFVAGGAAANQERPSSAHFHSAFGLMSLDDPRSENLLPFFQDLKNTTEPVPLDSWSQTTDPLSYTTIASSVPSHDSYVQPLLTPREAETRELREFWKQYMRTPLTGPQPSQAQSMKTPTPSNSGGVLPSTPSANGRRHRVNSLPAAKTPTADMYGVSNYGWYQPRASLPPHRPSVTPVKDDLKSYEAAVMARKPSTALVLPAARGVGSGIGLAAKRQSSTSELANVFGPAQAGLKIKFAPPPTSPKKSNGDARPSFKRNASQSLGPAESKRAKGDDDSSDGDDESGEPESDVSEDMHGNHRSFGSVELVHARA